MQYAAEDLVLILDKMRSQHSELRAEIRADFAEFKREIQAQFQTQDARFQVQFDRIDERFQALEGKLGDVKADLMKWSFVFWVGAATAIAVLAGVLDR